MCFNTMGKTPHIQAVSYKVSLKQSFVDNMIKFGSLIFWFFTKSHGFLKRPCKRRTIFYLGPTWHHILLKQLNFGPTKSQPHKLFLDRTLFSDP